MVSLFQRLTRANRSHRSLKKIKELRLKEVIQSFGIKRGEKLLKTYKKYNFFLSNRLFLCSKDRFDCVKDLILSIQSWSISFKRLPRAIWSWLIFLKDQRESRVIQSQSIFLKDRKEQKIEDQKVERLNSQPWFFVHCNKFPSVDFKQPDFSVVLLKVITMEKPHWFWNSHGVKGTSIYRYCTVHTVQ